MVVVDDVLNTGLVLAHALKFLLTVHIKQIKIAVLVNREHNKFPIKADFKGISLSTSVNETVKVNLNGKQIDGSTDEVLHMGDLNKKFSSFGWEVLEIKEGNNLELIIKTLKRAKTLTKKPDQNRFDFYWQGHQNQGVEVCRPTSQKYLQNWIEFDQSDQTNIQKPTQQAINKKTKRSSVNQHLKHYQ